MKLIVAFIRPEKLDAVQLAAQQEQAEVLSVSQVVGSMRDPGFTETYRGREVHVPRPKLRVEIAVDDPLVHRTVEAVVRAGRTGDLRNGGNVSFFVVQLDPCVRIYDPVPVAGAR